MDQAQPTQQPTPSIPHFAERSQDMALATGGAELSVLGYRAVVRSPGHLTLGVVEPDGLLVVTAHPKGKAYLAAQELEQAARARRLLAHWRVTDAAEADALALLRQAKHEGAGDA